MGNMGDDLMEAMALHAVRRALLAATPSELVQTVEVRGGQAGSRDNMTRLGAMIGSGAAAACRGQLHRVI